MDSAVEIIDSEKPFSQGNVNGQTELFVFHDDAIYQRYQTFTVFPGKMPTMTSKMNGICQRASSLHQSTIAVNSKLKLLLRIKYAEMFYVGCDLRTGWSTYNIPITMLLVNTR